ncbi:hypothetical protein [Streptomyces sp. NPDC007904]|jgi:hypothetical protein|uniref:hypothetical protein n=1 Tax=Streptomyces sp. NPDC007904 TaxID=3364787 RepID=UPI0036E3673B
MVVLAVIVPLLMLGVILVLGLYEDLLLPPRRPDAGGPGRTRRPDRAPAARPRPGGPGRDGPGPSRPSGASCPSELPGE